MFTPPSFASFVAQPYRANHVRLTCQELGRCKTDGLVRGVGLCDLSTAQLQYVMGHSAVVPDDVQVVYDEGTCHATKVWMYVCLSVSVCIVY